MEVIATVFKVCNPIGETTVVLLMPGIMVVEVAHDISDVKIIRARQSRQTLPAEIFPPDISFSVFIIVPASSSCLCEVLSRDEVSHAEQAALVFNPCPP